MSDLINRADAIEAVRQLRDTDGDVWGEALDTLTALPSAVAIDGDLISRADARKAFTRINDLRTLSLGKVGEVLDSLPSADADSDDLIIKGAKGIKDGLYNIKDGKLSKYYAKGGIVQAYEIVPSADVVQGEWIVTEHCTNAYGFRKWIEIECPFCGDKPTYEDLDNMNFCPNCGARMTPYKGGDTK